MGRPLPVPPGFALLMPGLTLNEARKRWRCGFDTVRRWCAEEGVAPAERSGPPPRAKPVDFEAVYLAKGARGALKHFNTCNRLIRRWVAESGRDLKAERAALRQPKRPTAKVAGTGSVKPAKRRQGAPSGPRFYQPAKDETLAGRAADYLRRDYAPVYHRGRENKAEAGIWQVGQKRLTESEMIALARGKGFEKPARPIPALVIRSSILEAQARGDVLPPPAGYDRYALPPVRSIDEAA